MSALRSLAISLLLLCNLGVSRLLTDPSQLTQTTYDYVIVGAGTAGSVLAARLTEDPGVSVLVLEAGVTNEDILNSMVPFLAPTLSPNTAVTWNYTTVSQPGLNGRSVPYPRGRILGGSSSINYLVYTRGARSDYDRFAAFTGDEGWSWDALLPFVFRNERLVPSADGHDTSGQVDPRNHGTGPLTVSLPGFPESLDAHIIQTTSELSGFDFNLDMNSGDTIGVGWTQSTIGNSHRASSATQFLQPAAVRPNLDVLIHSTVTKLIQTGTLNGKPEFKNVEFATAVNVGDLPSAQRHVVSARNEVILSAGATNTPQILLLSGLGPASHLSALGIQPVLDLPAVGAHLIDHVLACAPFSVNSNTTFDDFLRNATVAAAALQEWNTTGQGQFVDGVANQLGFFKVPANETTFSDPSSGPTAGNYELFFSNGYIAMVDPQPATGNFITICAAVVSPTSVGNITLSTSDPFTQPVINPALLTTDFDVSTLIFGLKSILRFLSAPNFASISPQPFGTFATALAQGGLGISPVIPHTPQGDAALEAFARVAGGTVFHPVGTAAMVAEGGEAGTSQGVVDSHLKVLGVEGVRIVDASVFPFIPAAHTQASVYVVAERASDLIKADYQ